MDALSENTLLRWAQTGERASNHLQSDFEVSLRQVPNHRATAPLLSVVPPRGMDSVLRCVMGDKADAEFRRSLAVDR